MCASFSFWHYVCVTQLFTAACAAITGGLIEVIGLGYVHTNCIQRFGKIKLASIHTQDFQRFGRRKLGSVHMNGIQEKLSKGPSTGTDLFLLGLPQPGLLVS